MMDRLREPLGVLAGLAILLLLLTFCTDGVGPTPPRFLSAPGSEPPAPAPLSGEVKPWDSLQLTLDDPWTPLLDASKAGASVAQAIAPRPPAPLAPRARPRGLFAWLKRRQPEPTSPDTEMDRVCEPPSPECCKRSKGGFQLGLRF